MFAHDNACNLQKFPLAASLLNGYIRQMRIWKAWIANPNAIAPAYSTVMRSGRTKVQEYMFAERIY